jgi:outer membrane immunogenic protein
MLGQCGRANLNLIAHSDSFEIDDPHDPYRAHRFPLRVAKRPQLQWNSRAIMRSIFFGGIAMKRMLLGLAAIAALINTPVLAADLQVKAPPPPPPPASSWTGFYVGVDGGYGWNQSTGNRECYNPAGVLFAACVLQNAPTGITPNGGLAGGEAGYNWQSGVVVTGIETDLQWSGMRASGAFVAGPPFIGSTYSNTDNMNWFGTTRGRIGLLVTPQLLAYGTIGGIYAHESVSTVLTIPGAVSLLTWPSNLATTRAGAVAGIGLEYAFNGNFSAKIEGLYYDLGSLEPRFQCPTAAVTCTPGFIEGGSFAWRGNMIRAGLNWHWGGGPIYGKD